MLFHGGVNAAMEEFLRYGDAGVQENAALPQCCSSCGRKRLPRRPGVGVA
jgi:hypothetical protein